MVIGGSKMRPTPATENELNRMLMHRRRDTSPGNPKWYKPPKAPTTFTFKAGAKPVYPARCMPNKIKPVEHVLVYCVDGPCKGTSLDLTASSSGSKQTLAFTLNGQTGRYVNGKWEAA